MHYLISIPMALMGFLVMAGALAGDSRAEPAAKPAAKVDARADNAPRVADVDATRTGAKE